MLGHLGVTEHREHSDIEARRGALADLALDVDALQAALQSGVPDKRVAADFRNGVRSGVNGTPTFFINGVRFDGDWRDEGSFMAALGSSA